MDPLAYHARTHPHRAAWERPGRRWTYAALHARAAGVAQWLRAQTSAAPLRVALHLPRGPLLAAHLWGIWRAGATAVLLNRRAPLPELRERLQAVDARLLFSTDEALRAAARNANMAAHAPLDTTAPSPRGASLPLDLPATVVFTSGSTGTPKAVLHTWGNHFWSARGAHVNMPLRRGDRWLASLPMYHVGGLAIVIRCMLAGATVVEAPDAPLHQSLQAMRATHVSMVTTQFRRCLQALRTPPAPLRAVLLGGGPLPNDLLMEGHAAGWPVHASYGSSEMASQITTTPPGAAPDALRTAGRVLPYRALRIATTGEIQVRGRPLFRGYLQPDGSLDPARTADGWFQTRDRGRLDDDNRLHVLGRLDRMFVSGGENIQPEAIERVLHALDDITHAAVVDVPDATYGARPVAFVAAAAWRPAAWRRALARRLPRYMTPDAFLPWPAEAHNGLKVAYDGLRARAIAARAE
ncbi:o-succinylbenzoate--CoA ligase [Salisaeta longa]|uniref:o-succinylbenzoate--CoA ligase n=1 Tax=Salisaeta longa TaxID=503170 RepID=UPI0003B3C8C6|nr:o-succinylbenzoate--CoA ligase [Salisaeta longa]